MLMCEVSDSILGSELSECSSLRTLRILDRGCCRGMWFVCTPSDSVSWITDGLFRLFLLHRLPFLEFFSSFYRFTSCLPPSPASAPIVLHLDASKAYAHAHSSTRPHTHTSTHTHTHWQWFGFAGWKTAENAEGITWKRWVTKLSLCFFLIAIIIDWFQHGKCTCCSVGKDWVSGFLAKMHAGHVWHCWKLLVAIVIGSFVFQSVFQTKCWFPWTLLRYIKSKFFQKTFVILMNFFLCNCPPSLSVSKVCVILAEYE